MESLAFAKAHQAQWERLDELTAKPRLSGPEADEFVRLYQASAAHLATVRTQAPDPDLILTLSASVGAARARLTEIRGANLRSLGRAITSTLPHAFYRIRWWAHAVGLAFVLICAMVMIYFRLNPNEIFQLGSYEYLRQYADEAFAAYYREFSGAQFGAMVWTNNAWIALQAVGGGITGIFPVYVIGQNAVGVGQAGAILDYFGALPVFFQLIGPHGLLELTAIFVAGAAGLKLFWTLLVPGDRPRLQALAAEGKQAMFVALGLVGVLFVSALVEGFVTPSYLHWGVKIAIGAGVLLAFWTWVYGFGRGETRDETPIRYAA
ncbi:stage II sporulation protein M [Trueperella sp.]|uniref:stage II sporulation protein M n=1 Tax=Trueperella sp. TaxID=2699835 RepID=UPI0022EB5812|nr:stage II sporulation protein M [Trueperella sp.]